MRLHWVQGWGKDKYISVELVTRETVTLDQGWSKDNLRAKSEYLPGEGEHK